MNSIFTGDLIARFLSLDRFQSDFRLQLCAVSLAYSWHPFPPFFVSLDTAILSYRPVQDLGTIIQITTIISPIGEVTDIACVLNVARPTLLYIINNIIYTDRNDDGFVAFFSLSSQRSFDFL